MRSALLLVALTACRASPAAPTITAQPISRPPVTTSVATPDAAPASAPDAALDAATPPDVPVDTAPATAPDATLRVAQLVFSQPDVTSPTRWADPWSVVLEVPTEQGAPRVYPVGEFSLTSPDYGTCPAMAGEHRHIDLSWPVGGGSFGLTMTFRGRTIAWDFVETAENDDARLAGTQRHARGRAELPAGVPTGRVAIVCRR